MSEKEEIFNATKERALKHPRWKMGAKVTIDSASMMNKGLEMIEAKWLFDVTPKEIEVVVHPQSIIHSMVQFADGAIIAQMGEPDMRIPIQYAISLGERWELNTPRTHFPTLSQMTFFAPDLDKFPCLRLAYEAVESGGNTTCIMNAANEVAVAAFLQDKIKFGEIPQIISQTIERVGYIATPTIDDIFETDKMAQIVAKELV
jgi:1-deoxy-D-xylulose-5-phosphate reductoisomerase